MFETVDTGTFTSATLLVIWGITQSFLLEYLWFVKDWFSALDPRKKQTANAAGLFIVVAIVFGLSVADILSAFTPDIEGALVALVTYFVALGVAQGVHTGTKKPSA